MNILDLGKAAVTQALSLRATRLALGYSELLGALEAVKNEDAPLRVLPETLLERSLKLFREPSLDLEKLQADGALDNETLALLKGNLVALRSCLDSVKLPLEEGVELTSYVDSSLSLPFFKEPF